MPVLGPLNYIGTFSVCLGWRAACRCAGCFLRYLPGSRVLRKHKQCLANDSHSEAVTVIICQHRWVEAVIAHMCCAISS